MVAPAARALLGALASGVLPAPLHAPLLYSLARAATTRRAPPPKPAPSSQASPSPPPPPPYVPPRVLLAAAAEACGTQMAAYSAEHLCTVFTSLAALDDALQLQVGNSGDQGSAAATVAVSGLGTTVAAGGAGPEEGGSVALLSGAWLDRFFDYAIPSQCPVPLLPGLATAVAAVAARQAAVAAADSASQEGDGVSSPSTPAPSEWLRRLEAAAGAGAESLGSRDAAVLLSALGRLGVRPAGATVERFLDLALTRSQREEEQRRGRQLQQLQGLQQAPVGVEAAGMAGLLAAVHSSLGFAPSAAWAGASRPLLMPVVARIADPRSRDAILAALDAASASTATAVL